MSIEPAHKSGVLLSLINIHLSEDPDLHLRYRRIIRSCETLDQLNIAHKYGWLALENKKLTGSTVNYYYKQRRDHLEYKFAKIIEKVVFGHEMIDIDQIQHK